VSRFVVAGLMTTILVSGCSSSASTEGVVHRGTVLAEAPVGYVPPPTLTTSLFKSDQAVMGDESIQRILSSKVVLAEDARLALLKFPEPQNAALRYYGYQYWRSEDYLKTQQEYIDTITRKVTASDRVHEVILLPSLVTPAEPTIPTLREAAVRLQADLLLVFRLMSDIYYQPKLFAQDQVKAYCTCEAVLLDVRTGTIPFTTVTTRDRMEKKEKQDLSVNETMRRAEMSAVLDALNGASDKLVGFLAKASPANVSASVIPAHPAGVTWRP
jgi:hypothetical protein